MKKGILKLENRTVGLRNKNNNQFFKNIEAKAKVTGVAVLMIAVALSSVFVLMPNNVVKADSGSWTSTIGYLPHDTRNGASIFYNHSIYIFGGYNDTGVTFHDEIIRYFPEAYDGHSANETLAVTTMPAVRWIVSLGFDDTHTQVVNDCVWIMGGNTGNAYVDTIWCFTFNNNTCWDTGDTLPAITGQCGPSVVDSNGIVYMFAGANAAALQDTIKAYNHSNGTVWIYDTLTTGIIYSYGGSFSETNNTYYIAGGKTELVGTGGPRTDVIAYCFDNNTDWKIDDLATNAYTLVGSACWNNQSNTILIFGGQVTSSPNVWTDDVNEINCTTNTVKVINNLSTAADSIFVCWGHNDTKYLAYLVGGNDDHRIVRAFDLDITYSEGGGTTASNFSISGLDGDDRITWSGEAGETVWSNASSYGTLTIQTNINATDNCTAIYLDIADFDSVIDADNISVEVRNTADGTFDGTTTALGSSPNYNLTINSSAGSWFQGTNPFPMDGAAWTNITLEVHFTCAIPSGAGAGTYVNTSASWNVLWKIIS